MVESATYRLSNAAWKLSFAPEALAVFRRHAQTRPFSRESVGQLYARDLTAEKVEVGKATLLQPTLARWARVRFDVQHAMQERVLLYSEGWHCVGFWHTHPEVNPQPSREDKALAMEHARAALSATNGLIFAILGTQPLPAGLRVWFHDGIELGAMRPSEEGEDVAG